MKISIHSLKKQIIVMALVLLGLYVSALGEFIIASALLCSAFIVSNLDFKDRFQSWCLETAMLNWQAICIGSNLKRMWPFKNQQAVVGWHGVVCCQIQTSLCGKPIDLLEIPDAACRVLPFQPLVKSGIAFASVLTLVIKRAVNADHCCRSQINSQLVE